MDRSRRKLMFGYWKMVSQDLLALEGSLVTIKRVTSGNNGG